MGTTTPLTERIRSPSRSEPCCCVPRRATTATLRGGAASSCVTVPSSVRSKPTRSPAARTNQVASAERGPTERAASPRLLPPQDGRGHQARRLRSPPPRAPGRSTRRCAWRGASGCRPSCRAGQASVEELEGLRGPNSGSTPSCGLSPQNPLSRSACREGLSARACTMSHHGAPRRRRIAERRAASMLATTLLAPGVTLTTSTTVPGVDRFAVHRFVATPDNWPSIVLSSQSVAGKSTNRPIQPGESVDEIFGAPPILPLRVTWTCVATDEDGGTLDLVSDAGLGGVAHDCRMKFAVADASDGVRVELRMSYTPTSILATLAHNLRPTARSRCVLLRRALLNTSCTHTYSSRTRPDRLEERPDPLAVLLDLPYLLHLVVVLLPPLRLLASAASSSFASRPTQSRSKENFHAARLACSARLSGAVASASASSEFLAASASRPSPPSPRTRRRGRRSCAPTRRCTRGRRPRGGSARRRRRCRQRRAARRAATACAAACRAPTLARSGLLLRAAAPRCAARRVVRPREP